ncbi:hypothetical protein [Cohnella herbarum]|uniref:Uncharacterized protein n=1 Tax=Cohnella herbarum TaxID=2728023 RepID=A0A7Z2ZPD5_9BACL|nr:hypothetical protein [Cohnella herbarum]QJD87336.1 hypothetical protein HH215_31935 [Cohnella herbarum]
MGLLYNIYSTMLERNEPDKMADEMDHRAENTGISPSEDELSLIELLVNPVGRRAQDE